MSDAWSDRLSEYLDGDLSPAELREVEAHLRGCPDCRALVAELRQVADRLGSDSVRPSDQPTLSQWRSIRRTISPRRRRWIVPVALAASLAGLLLASALLRPGAPIPATTTKAPASYVQATGDLEAILREHKSRLRPETVTALEASLAAIDSALAQAERALAQDPANDYVTRSMGNLREARLTMLRRAVSVALSKES